jgi:hypothetical protein
MPEFVWYQLLIALVAAGAVVIATTGLILVLMELRFLRRHINSRMDQLLEVAEAAAYARGHRAGEGLSPETERL